MKQLITIPILTASLVIAGCHNSGSENNDPPPNPQNRLSDLATQGLDSEPGAIVDAAVLKEDIITLFGSADNDPVAINPGDDIQTVLDRASGR